MIGDFKEINGKNYLIINNGGTLKRLPKLKWYNKLYLYFLNHFKGYVHINDIDNLIAKQSKSPNR